MMPSLGLGGVYPRGGYATNALVRQEVQQAVNDFREAQQLAISENVPIKIYIFPDVRATQKWVVYQAPGGTLTELLQNTIPPQLKLCDGLLLPAGLLPARELPELLREDECDH